MKVDDTSTESVQELATHASPTTIKPPFPGRLVKQPPSVENQAILDLLEQLKKMIVKILLLDAIKEVPIYTKAIKEACIKTPRRKKKRTRKLSMSLENFMISC